MIFLIIKMINKNKFYFYLINSYKKKQKIYNKLKMLKIIYINK